MAKKELLTENLENSADLGSKKPKKQVKEIFWGSYIRVGKASFWIENTPECVAKLEGYGLNDYLE